ncbi:MAG: hypothetical protein QOE58_918, partial [Actinomycetota bacterium]|nr:hypothetical protein [Actinomycetota bacterium]
ERDTKGIITTVRYKSVRSYKAEAAVKGATVNKGPGEKKGYTESVVELPTHTAADQAIAQRYLNEGGVGPMGGFKDLPKGVDLQIRNAHDPRGPSKEFAQAAGDHGVVTEQEFDDGDSGTYAVNLDAEVIAKLGVSATVDKVGRKSKGLKWFNGKDMVPEKGCVSK